ncbi:hypothetical protein PSEUDO9AZ_10077 [Pseudomonas sp. 9AZ]|nr:hypothetical protein PSEUDO9AZ_10077 [Pseudomonas sp. 9AZ]
MLLQPLGHFTGSRHTLLSVEARKCSRTASQRQNLFSKDSCAYAKCWSSGEDLAGLGSNRCWPNRIKLSETNRLKANKPSTPTGFWLRGSVASQSSPSNSSKANATRQDLKERVKPRIASSLMNKVSTVAVHPHSRPITDLDQGHS